MCLFPYRAAVAVLAAIAAAFLLGHAAAPVSLDMWDMEAALTLRRETQRERAIEDSQDEQLRKIEACNDIAAALIDERIAFASAVDDIEAIKRDSPGFAEGIACRFPEAQTHRERVAQYLIGKVQLMLADDPERLARTLVRLEAEHRALFSLD